MEEYKKKYEEAILRMNKWVEGSEIVDPKEVAEFVFPELKESDDERIGKQIIGYLNRQIDSSDFGGDIAIFRKWITWIERKGEKNLSTDFSDLRTWKYIVDAVWTEKEGIGQYLDSPFTEETAKKLQKRFGNIEQKPTWSEEDENYCLDVNAAVSDYFDEGYAEELKDWLKSLKERYTWKPSNEQMHYLSWIANIKLGDSVVEQEVSKHLNELLEDLKKLSGE